MIDAAAASVPAVIPRALLFGNPERIAPRIAPDGSRLAWIAPDEGVLNVWTGAVDGTDARVITRDRGRGIRSYTWSEDGRRILYIQDTDGDENWHLYAVDAAGEGEAIDLTPIDGVQARIVATDPDRPNEILIAMNDRDPSLHDVHRIELSTGARSIEVPNDLGAVGWVADHTLTVRAASVPTPDGGSKLLFRNGNGDGWRELRAWEPDDALGSGAIGFAGDNRTLYLRSSIGTDTATLRTLDPVSGEEREIAADPEADVMGVLSHPTTHAIEAVAFLKDRIEWRAIDDAVRGDFDALRKVRPGDLSIVDRDRSDRTWIVAFTDDDGPVRYYVWDRGGREATFLFAHRPELEPLPLAPMRPVRFTARDGLEIHAYLTVPAGSDGKNLPLVLNVHGGPWARDSWGFDPEAQWLANRGYACLQVNYRGSIGYGKSFVNAADREWGGKMQDDLTDAVRWAIDRGIADPARVGIFGGSYGGYAVLAGLTFTPDLYTCGVSLVGPSNLITFINTIPPYWRPMIAMMHRRVGHPEEDADFLKSRSPLFAVDRIRAPLLLVHGKNDPRVKLAESRQIRDALQAAGKTVETIEYPDEGHGFARPENRLSFYAAAERFLAEHLGGRVEPV